MFWRKKPVADPNCLDEAYRSIPGNLDKCCSNPDLYGPYCLERSTGTTPQPPPIQRVDLSTYVDIEEYDVAPRAMIVCNKNQCNLPPIQQIVPPAASCFSTMKAPCKYKCSAAEAAGIGFKLTPMGDDFDAVVIEEGSIAGRPPACDAIKIKDPTLLGKRAIPYGQETPQRVIDELKTKDVVNFTSEMPVRCTSMNNVDGTSKILRCSPKGYPAKEVPIKTFNW